MSDFTLDDFKAQMQRVLNPGLLERAARIMMTREMREILADDEWREDARRTIGIIESMTLAERLDPNLIDESRTVRIARGAGVSQENVQLVLNQHNVMSPVIGTMQRRSTVGFTTVPLPRWWSKRFGKGDS